MTVVPRWLLPAQLAALDGRPAGRRTARDWAADAGLFAFAVIMAIEQAAAYPPPGAEFVPGWLVAINPWVAGPACLALWWRRRFPLVLGVVMVVALSFSASSVGAAMVAGLTVAVHRPWGRAAAVSGSYLVICGYYGLFAEPPGVERPVLIASLLIMFGGPLCLGMAVRARRLLLLGLRREAEVRSREHRLELAEAQRAERERRLELAEAQRAEREHRLALREARRAERERLAREMHDVLAHRVSLLSVHAGALAYRTSQAAAGTGPPVDASEVGGAARVIQDNARLALDELRDVLAVLRDGEPAATRPQPGLADLPRLVAEAEAAGQRVHYSVGDEVARPGGAGPGGSVRAQVQRTAYRTVQEGLTNARRHAPGAPVRVRIEGSPGADLVVTVDNPAAGAGGVRAEGGGAGRGLVGLGERVALDGGRLEHGVRDGVFVLSARLPWQV
ncbi:signal transduction histidine kinase [Nonomuraea fuscirosea]|uniref:histidine kinase n=1 Tax=Nonomuraea fuscirosea TaxID=1291556 RepID=A0A2T0MTT4_9ACTN|nr:histidine kinase [Nonomuraea fuscirosea]PRX62111.1 signal transduction histidine kinase [Nonomuraea fuscirosea]